MTAVEYGRSSVNTAHVEELPPFDEVLIEAQHGNEEAFADMWHRCSPGIVQTAGRIAGFYRADDVAQMTALRVLAGLPEFQPPQEKAKIEPSFRSWVNNIAHNLAVDELRHEGRQPDMLSLEYGNTEQEIYGFSLLEDPSVNQKIETAETMDAMSMVIDRLPLRYRDIVRAIDIEGIKSGQYAEVMGINPTTVRTALHKGRRLVRELIQNGALDELEPMASPADIGGLRLVYKHKRTNQR